MYNDKWFKCPNSQGCQDPVERRSTSPNFVTNIYGFLIERNSQFSIRQPLSVKVDYLASPCDEELDKRKHPSLVLLDGSKVNLNQQSIYQPLFHEPLLVHDAMLEL